MFCPVPPSSQLAIANPPPAVRSTWTSAILAKSGACATPGCVPEALTARIHFLVPLERSWHPLSGLGYLLMYKAGDWGHRYKYRLGALSRYGSDLHFRLFRV